MPLLKVALVGFGAIGEALARELQSDPVIRITQIVVPPGSLQRAAWRSARFAPAARVAPALDLGASGRPAVVAECAGHEAVWSHVLPALVAGVPCIVASVGALHRSDDFFRLEAAAQQGRTRVQLISGAVGAIDALAAARVGGLDEVTYVGTKPPPGWSGTPAEQVCDLATLTEPCVIFEGSAREAALAYPKNANVAAAIGLAGLGLDRTRVRLVADPGVTRNTHSLVAIGAFGRLEMRLENLPLAGNPKTSALAAYSLIRAIRNMAAPVVF